MCGPRKIYGKSYINLNIFWIDEDILTQIWHTKIHSTQNDALWQLQCLGHSKNGSDYWFYFKHSLKPWSCKCYKNTGVRVISITSFSCNSQKTVWLNSWSKKTLVMKLCRLAQIMQPQSTNLSIKQELFEVFLLLILFKIYNFSMCFMFLVAYRIKFIIICGLYQLVLYLLVLNLYPSISNTLRNKNNSWNNKKVFVCLCCFFTLSWKPNLRRQQFECKFW